MGTPADCQRLVWQLKSIGINEIACLIDFIDDHEAVLESLEFVNELRASLSAEVINRSITESVSAFMEELE
jgi:hypothetical protein